MTIKGEYRGISHRNDVDLAAWLARRPKTGSIGFQDHGLPISLRNIRIKELK